MKKSEKYRKNFLKILSSGLLLFLIEITIMFYAQPTMTAINKDFNFVYLLIIEILAILLISMLASIGLLMSISSLKDSFSVNKKR